MYRQPGLPTFALINFGGFVFVDILQQSMYIPFSQYKPNRVVSTGFDWLGNRTGGLRQETNALKLKF